MRCPVCDKETEEGGYCSECGAPLPKLKKCPVCGAMIPEKMNFCPECSSRLDGTTYRGGIGLSMGDKNVVAGDVIGKKDDYHFSGNATIVQNEDETKKILFCAVCGKHLTNAEGHTCPDCGRFVCGEHFDSQKYRCVLCVKRQISDIEKSYIEALEKAYADGRVDLSERAALNSLKSRLGLSSEKADELERSVADSHKKHTVSLSRADKAMLSQGKKALYEDFDYGAVFSLAKGLYERNPNNEEILDLYLYSFSLTDRQGADFLPFVDSLEADFATAYHLKINRLLDGGGDINAAESLLNEALEKFPDDFRIACDEVLYLFALGMVTGSEPLFSEAQEKLNLIGEPQGELESEIHKFSIHFASLLIETKDFGKASSELAEFYSTHKDEKHAKFACSMVENAFIFGSGQYGMSSKSGSKDSAIQKSTAATETPPASAPAAEIQPAITTSSAPRLDSASKPQAALRLQPAPKPQFAPKPQSAPRLDSAPKPQSAPRLPASPKTPNPPKPPTAPKAPSAPKVSAPRLPK